MLLGDGPEMTTALAATPQPRRTYDHRLREQVLRTGTKALTGHLAIPRSTVSTWRRRGLRPVLTMEPLEQGRQQMLNLRIVTWMWHLQALVDVSTWTTDERIPILRIPGHRPTANI